MIVNKGQIGTKLSLPCHHSAVRRRAADLGSYVVTDSSAAGHSVPAHSPGLGFVTTDLCAAVDSLPPTARRILPAKPRHNGLVTTHMRLRIVTGLTTALCKTAARRVPGSTKIKQLSVYGCLGVTCYTLRILWTC